MSISHLSPYFYYSVLYSDHILMLILIFQIAHWICTLQLFTTRLHCDFTRQWSYRRFTFRLIIAETICTLSVDWVKLWLHIRTLTTEWRQQRNAAPSAIVHCTHDLVSHDWVTLLGYSFPGSVFGGGYGVDYNADVDKCVSQNWITRDRRKREYIAIKYIISLCFGKIYRAADAACCR